MHSDNEGAELLGALSALHQTLEHEHQALQDRDPAAVETCAERKRALAERIETLTGRNRPRGAALLLDPEIRTRVQRCRDLNERNGAVVGALARAVNRAQSVLAGGGAGASLYASDGAITSTPGSGRYSGSA